MLALVFEAFNLFVLVRIGKGDAQPSSLGAEKASAGHGDAPHQVFFRDAFRQFFVGMHGVKGRRAEVAAPSQMVEQGTLKRQVAYGVASFVKVEQPVQSDGSFRADESACGRIVLQPSAGADAHQLQLPERIFLLARQEVDVCQCIQFVHYDVDVVTADSG